MRVLVTGGMGWTASAIVDALHSAGHTPRVLDLPGMPVPDGYPRHRLEVFRGDIADADAVRAACSDVDKVIHLAVATDREAYRAPGLPLQVNVGGTYNVFAGLRAAGRSDVVLISSAAVHLAGDARSPTTWRSSSGPDHLYDLTKRLQEEIARDFCETYAMNATVLRSGHIVDGRTGLDPEGRPLADLTYCRGGWIDRYDLARACLGAIEGDLRGFRVLNVVGAGEGYERFDVARAEVQLGFQIVSRFEDFPPDR